MQSSSLSLQDSGGHHFTLELYEPSTPPAGVVIVVPGARCEAIRYRWLGRGLTQSGLLVSIIQPPVVSRLTPFSPTTEIPIQMATVDHVMIASQGMRKLYSPRLPQYGVGHSHGGAVLMEGLDFNEAVNNPYAELPAGFTGFEAFDTVAILGAQLQPDAMGQRFEHRSADKPLSKPESTRLVLIAAEHDEMASPAAVKATASRFGEDVEHHLLEGGNHLGWLEGEGEHDRPDLDGTATISSETQRQRTNAMIISLLAGDESQASLARDRDEPR